MITVSTIINADIKKVWSCWTAPNHIVNWNFASPDWHCPTAESDFTEGGKFNYEMAARDGSMSFGYAGTFKKIEENHLLDFELEDGRNVSVRFIEQGDTTRIEESFEPENMNSEELQRQGWQAILNNFKVYTESL